MFQQSENPASSNVSTWLGSHLRRYTRLLVAGVGSYLLAWGLLGYTPILLGNVADVALETHEASALLGPILLLLGIIMVEGISRFGSTLLIEKLAQHLVHNIRQQLIDTLIDKDQLFYDRQNPADLVARATDDVGLLGTMVNPGLLFATQVLFGLTVPIGYLFVIHWQVALIATAFAIVYLLTMWRYARQLAPVMMEQRSVYAQLSTQVEETIFGAQTIKAGAHETYEKERLQKVVRSYKDAVVAQGRVEFQYLPSLLYAFALGLVFWQAMGLYFDGILSVGEVIAVMSLMATLRFSIFGPILILSYIQLGYAAAERILSAIRGQESIDLNPGGYAAPVGGGITFENISFAYDQSQTLQNLSFHLEAGQTLAILGQVGSGKTTLTQLINRTYDVNSGQVLVDGIDVRDWNLSHLRSQIGRVEQNVFLFDTSVAENIAFDQGDTHLDRVIEAAKQAEAHEFIEALPQGYHTPLGQNGAALSGGQRQRLALARAFYSEPSILILDDSTHALDSATEERIWQSIQRLSQRCTLVMITHRLPLVMAADRIMVLEQGRCIAFGTHHTLLRSSRHYRRIFQTQGYDLPPFEASEVPGGLDGLHPEWAT
jgi:ATP-binding cassette subfamily B protein